MTDRRASLHSAAQVWAHPSPPAPRAGVAGRVALRASEQPRALAICGGGESLDYQNLVAQSLALAGRLRNAGVREQDLVALCLPRSVDLVVGALGILASGAAYVALDPSQPDARLQYMLENSGASILVAHQAVGRRLRADHVLAPRVPPGDAGNEEESAAQGPAAPASLAYVVYTSGSTGNPKGVLVEQDGLLNLADWHARAFSQSVTDRSTLLMNPGFDVSANEIWPTLLSGGSLHVADEAIKNDPPRLRDWLVAEAITQGFVAAPLAEELIALDWPRSTALRYLHTGGDVLHHRPRPGLPFALVNNYGLCEVTVTACSGIVEAPCEGQPDLPPIGRAIDNSYLRVIDEGGQPVADGVAGELLVCGACVARGYLNLPEQTAQRFITDPLDPSVRAFRTGDRARVGADGSVEFINRADEQVQVRGHRVEPGEIVHALNDYPQLRNSVVVPAQGPGGVRLCAFVIGEPGERIDITALRAHASSRLPDHMLPSLIVQVDDLPTTAHGKVDKSALVELAVSFARSRRNPHRLALVEPRNEQERVLADLVAELLWLPEVSVDENFFLLGGHSLLGAQLIGRISEIFEVEMTMLALFDNPTVESMAIEVERLIIEQIDGMPPEALLSDAEAREQ
ncbi:non-ribosomal peptide synthetase [Hoyosella sp. G463]|uniref:Non-ribosomal peptide synthetase n=1 Tax=Lolliginicoccus lacisalsi TaxID=2742202 RepID=A0A927JB38_9ACTN|nr:non-ribosomal peptide synthetase [Lolliginicoccus lacisalsi]MBD8505167.1 non-ribosomal peptide synthetase [Lolliginicoccus lacisalsi]